MKYYYDLMSQPSRAVYIFLKKNKINFTNCPVALRKGEHRTSEYARINPFQLVPAIDDDGFKLTESVAILRYLINKFKDNIPDHWYPSDIQKLAKVDEYMEWQHLNTRMNCAMYFQQKLLIPLMTQSPPNEKKVAQFQNRMEDTLNKFESIWLKDEEFIAGNSITIADLLAVCELQQPSMAGYDIFENRPKLTAWFNKVKDMLQPEYSEASSVVEKVKTMYTTGEIKLPSSKL